MSQESRNIREDVELEQLSVPGTAAGGPAPPAIGAAGTTGDGAPEQSPIRSRARGRTTPRSLPKPGISWFRNYEIKDGTKKGNILRGWSGTECDSFALELTQIYGSTATEQDFLKAARVLRNPDQYHLNLWPEYIGSLTEEEKIALDTEFEGTVWHQPLFFKVTVILLCVAAMVQGWSQTALTDGNLTWVLDLFHETPTEGNACGPYPGHNWQFAAVNAAPYLAGGIGCWFSDTLINELLFGRRGAILVSAMLMFASAIGGAVASTWQGLLICRILTGLGMGCKAAVVPVWLAEIAPSHLRGSLVTNWQVFDAFGILAGFSANLVATRAGNSAWRWQIASSALPAFALLFCVLLVPWDSPRYFMKHQDQYRRRYDRKMMRSHRQRKDSREPAEQDVHSPPPDPAQSARPVAPSRVWVWGILDYLSPNSKFPYMSKAFETLVLLRGHRILAAKELLYSHALLLAEMHSSERDASRRGRINLSLESMHGRAAFFRRLKNLFWKPYVRREVYAAAVVMIGQQLCGINVLIFYSSTLFCRALSDRSTGARLLPMILSWGIGLVNFACTLPAYRLIDKRGRRWLLLCTLPFMFAAMAIAAITSAALGHNSNSQVVVVGVFAYLFTAVYSLGMGPVPFTLSAEIFPLEERMVGMSLAVSCNFLGAGFLALGVPFISRSGVALGIFAACNVLALVGIWAVVREVAADASPNDAASQEALFQIYRPSTFVYVKYQLTEVLPHWWSRIRAMQIKDPHPPQDFLDWELKRRKRQRSV